MNAKRFGLMESLVDGLMTRLFLVASRLTGCEVI